MVPNAVRYGIAATVLIACFAPTDVCGCPPALGVGTIAGVVQRSTGEPAPGALVRAELSIFNCVFTDSHLVDDRPARATAAGVYRHDLRAYGPSDSACVRLTAIDTADGRRDSTTVSGVRMRLISSYGTKQRPESLRVDMLLP